MEQSIVENGRFCEWYVNFFRYYKNEYAYSQILKWTEYVNDILKIDLHDQIIIFESEEDCINFILKWS